MTYATVHGLLNNAEVRSASPAIKAAYDNIEASASGTGCSACAKKKKSSEVINQLISQLQGASEMELDRIKRALGVEKLVFPNGLSFVER